MIIIIIPKIYPGSIFPTIVTLYSELKLKKKDKIVPTMTTISSTGTGLYVIIVKNIIMLFHYYKVYLHGEFLFKFFIHKNFDNV